ncbi:MAG: hypothetical protein M1383_00420 [Patescibacteria group bacterium]|nr:hypothetical protein [Patescibacteria group bacterium]
MDEREKIQKLINLIEKTDLDQTIKDILIRDLKSEGITEFIKEQIKAYCLEEIKQIDEAVEEAKKILEEQNQQNPPEV